MEGTWACLNLWQEVRTKRGMVDKGTKAKPTRKHLMYKTPLNTSCNLFICYN